MSGPNGLTPVANLTERQKCPVVPSKRKYATAAEAKIAADESSQRSGLEIGAYLCTGCGQYHLTKSVGGASVTLPEGKFSVGDFKAKAPAHPVFIGQSEQVTDTDDGRIVPGDHESRVRYLREYLATHSEPTSAELLPLLDCDSTTLRKAMLEVGYRNTRGRHARWVPATAEEPKPTPEPEPPTTPFNHAPIPDVQVIPRKREIDPQRIGHMAVADLIATYEAAGLRVVITVWPGNA